jgi:hypothetical protein
MSNAKVVVEIEDDNGIVIKLPIKDISIPDGKGHTNEELLLLALRAAEKKLAEKGQHRTLDEFEQKAGQEPECTCVQFIKVQKGGQEKLDCILYADPGKECPVDIRRDNQCPYTPPEGVSQEAEKLQELNQLPATITSGSSPATMKQCREMTGAGTCKLAGDCPYLPREREEFGCTIPVKKKITKTGKVKGKGNAGT